MEDCYKILGTSREAVYYKGRDTEEKRDEFIKEKFNDKIRLIKNKVSKANSPEEIEECKRIMNQVNTAYEQIKSPILRDSYNQRLDQMKAKEFDQRYNFLKKKNAYDILRISRDTMKNRTEEANNNLIRKRRDNLIQYYSKMLKQGCPFTEKNKIELAIQEIIDSYELIGTKEKRETYDLQLQKEKEEIEYKRKRLYIRDKYSHSSECDFTLIENRGRNIQKYSTDEAISRKTETEHVYEDNEKRNLRIRNTGRISFTNSLGLKSFVEEYEVKRLIEGQEKIDTIYGDINIAKLSKNKKTGKLVDSDYYDCVINDLLSEDTIEGARYNAGYIGQVEQDEKGKYSTTLGRKKMRPSEKEMLTAVMLVKKREEKGKDLSK